MTRNGQPIYVTHDSTSEQTDEALPLLRVPAAELYRALLAEGPRPVTSLDEGDPRLTELLRHRFVSVVGDELWAVAPDRAVRIAMAEWRDETTAALERLLASTTELEQLQESWDRRQAPADRLVTLLTDPDVVGSVSADLMFEAKREVLTFSTGRTRHHPARVVAPPAEMVERGVEFRAVWETACWERPDGPVNAARCLEAGSRIRLTPTLPTKMVLADDTAALVALTPMGADGALLVRSTVLVAAFRRLFESVWERAVPCPGLEGSDADAVARTIVRLLATDMPDAVIARRLGISDRTLRRHISGLERQWDVSTRFTLAVAAQRRGWLD